MSFTVCIKFKFDGHFSGLRALLGFIGIFIICEILVLLGATGGLFFFKNMNPKIYSRRGLFIFINMNPKTQSMGCLYFLQKSESEHTLGEAFFFQILITKRPPLKDVFELRIVRKKTTPRGYFLIHSFFEKKASPRDCF